MGDYTNKTCCGNTTSLHEPGSLGWSDGICFFFMVPLKWVMHDWKVLNGWLIQLRVMIIDWSHFVVCSCTEVFCTDCSPELAVCFLHIGDVWYIIILTHVVTLTQARICALEAPGWLQCKDISWLPHHLIISQSSSPIQDCIKALRHMISRIRR